MAKQDQIIRCLAYGGRISIICANTTKFVEKARNIHELSPTVTAAFGRLLTMTAIMGIDMKQKKNRLTIQLKGNGPIGTMVTVSDNTPKIKGYVTNPFVEVPLNEDGKIDVGRAVGNTGYINVIKDLGMKEPYIGISPLTSGEVAEDFAEYFVNSEQKKAAVALGVLVNKEGVKSSGGYVIYPMPDATSEDILKVEKSIFQAGAISKMLDQNLTLEEIVKKITGDDAIEVLQKDIVPTYECDCSKEKMERGLMTIGKEEIEKMLQEDGKAELVCHFCNCKYEFNKSELEKIKNNIEK